MRAVLRVASLLALAVTVVVAALAVAPRTAHACVCGGPDDPPLLPEDVDVAVIGRPVAEDYSDNPYRLVIEFEVDRVYKGNVGPRIEVHSSKSNCGIRFGGFEDWRDDRYSTSIKSIVAHESDEGILSTGLCLSFAVRGRLEDVFGPGYPPDLPISPQAPDDGSTAVEGGVDSAANDEPGNSSIALDRDSVDATTEDAADDGSPHVASPGPGDDVETTSADATDDGASPIGALASTLVISVAAILVVWLLVARRRARRSPPPV